MFPVFAGNSASTGYNLTRSLRIRQSAGAYLNRTFTSSGNQKKWTWSGWIKRGLDSIADDRMLFSGTTNGSTTIGALFFNGGNNNLRYVDILTSPVNYQTNIATTPVYRDFSAWYHIILAVDTTQATAANRFRFYVNGVEITAFSTAVYPAQNTDTYINSAQQHRIGSYPYSAPNYDGYMAEINFIDGQQLTPSSFGETNTLTGVWQPARYTGTYGTNGFYLPFTDNSALTTSSNVGLGRDYSGNGNYWTTNNISITAGVTYDSMTDVPTLTSATAANFAVLNPISNPNGPIYTVSSGNLNLQNSASVGNAPKMSVLGSFFIQSGKWYWEIKETSVNSMFGITSGLVAGGNAVGPQYANIANGSAAATAATYSGTTPTFVSGDVMGFAFDRGALTLAIYKNGTLLGTFSGLESFVTGWLTLGGASSSAAASSSEWNFGQRPFAYTPPTGYVSLNTYNLPTSTIVKGNTVMDATLYSGNNAATQTIVNAAGFKPDAVWLKSRSTVDGWAQVDSVRGVNKLLQSNNTNAESTTGSVTAFNSNGFSADINFNVSGRTYVGYQWQAGQGTTSTNTNGTITSTVSVNASAGFSIVTYTGSSPSGTVGHGLGVAPSVIIVKQRSASGNSWPVWFTGVTSTTQYLYLNGTNPLQTSTNTWNSTAPTSSVFSVGNDSVTNTTGSTYVAYCWTPIAGFSSFGSYSGNGSTDGPFVYLGFRPKFVMIKKTATSSGDRGWIMIDSSRSPYNVIDAFLYANSSDAEFTNQPIDFLSNGFKVRTDGVVINNSGVTNIYMAFAENPFKNSLAR